MRTLLPTCWGLQTGFWGDSSPIQRKNGATEDTEEVSRLRKLLYFFVKVASHCGEGVHLKTANGTQRLFRGERPGKKGENWLHKALSWQLWQVNQELMEKGQKIGICYRSVHPKGKEIQHSLVNWKKPHNLMSSPVVMGILTSWNVLGGQRDSCKQSRSLCMCWRKFLHISKDPNGFLLHRKGRNY